MKFKLHKELEELADTAFEVILFLLCFATLPIWFIPYGIYKRSKAGKLIL